MMPERDLCYTTVPSPIGVLLLAGTEDALHRVLFPAGRHPQRPADGWRRSDGPFAQAREQLAAYFGGELRDFDLPLAMEGTGFQRTVWRTLRGIPFGETVSYGTIAARIGKPSACRAVGAANGANPIPIIVPCHRVIGSSGALTGFGGGIETKRLLLAFEREHMEPALWSRRGSRAPDRISASS